MTLSKDYRLRLQIIDSIVRLNRDVTFEEMVRATKLCKSNKHAMGIWERTVGCQLVKE